VSTARVCADRLRSVPPLELPRRIARERARAAADSRVHSPRLRAAGGAPTPTFRTRHGRITERPTAHRRRHQRRGWSDYAKDASCFVSLRRRCRSRRGLRDLARWEPPAGALPRPTDLRAPPRPADRPGTLVHPCEEGWREFFARTPTCNLRGVLAPPSSTTSSPRSNGSAARPSRRRALLWRRAPTARGLLSLDLHTRSEQLAASATTSTPPPRHLGSSLQQ